VMLFAVARALLWGFPDLPGGPDRASPTPA
jgi:hypothetical protein